MKLVSPKIEHYCQNHSHPISDNLKNLAQHTQTEFEYALMMVGATEGNFLRVLIRLSQAKKVLEIGTFTGYSALSMAEVLPSDGTVITCDISVESTQTAQNHWDKSPHGKKIKLHLGPALESIQRMNETFDLIFIDADKENYFNYWQAALPKLRSGGLIVVDNVLWSGRVLNPEDPTTQAIADFNQQAAADPRVEVVMLPIRDGMLLAWKKPEETQITVS